MIKLVIGLLLVTIAQVSAWFLLNGQFIWSWFRDNNITVVVIGGIFTTYVSIISTDKVVQYFNGSLWSSRFIFFAIGIISFAILTSIFKNEHITIKHIISILLSIVIIFIQFLIK